MQQQCSLTAHISHVEASSALPVQAMPHSGPAAAAKVWPLFRLRVWIKYLPLIGALAAAILATALAYTKVPFADEGTFAGSALNLKHTGFTGNPSTPPYGLGIPLIESQKYNYWVLPGHLYALAGWYHFTPETLLSARMLSVLFGIVVVLMFYVYVKLLSRSVIIAGLCCLIFATDFNMVSRASVARMGSMSLFLNVSCWVAYLALRNKNIFWGLFSSALLGAASLVTHPNGLFAFVGLAALIAVLDLRRIRWTWALPLLAGVAIPFALYIANIRQAPDVWSQQLAAHSVRRFNGILTPWESIRMEFYRRYFGPFGGWAPGVKTAPARVILLMVLAAYLGSAVYMLQRRLFRKPIVAVSFVIFTVNVLYWTFFDNGKLQHYLIHLLPWYALFVSMATVDLYRKEKWRKVVPAGVAIVITINVAASLAYVYGDRFHRNYVPVRDLLQAQLKPGDVVLGHAFMGFDIGWGRVTEDYTLVDIVRRNPRFVIMDDWFTENGDTKAYEFGQDPMSAGMFTAAEKSEAISRLKSHYRTVLENPDFRVMERTGAAD